MIAILAAVLLLPSQAQPAQSSAETTQGASVTDKRILGQWDMMPHVRGKEMIYEFKDDGSATFIMSAQVPGIRGTVWLTILEAYKLEGNTIAMKPADAHFSCKDMGKKAILDNLEQQYQKLVVDAPPGSGPITWVDKDNLFFTITTPATNQRKSDSKLVVLKRRKAKMPVLPGVEKDEKKDSDKAH